jgi:hypothetical protein
MYEILQLYTSSFWVWLGITIGLGVLINGLREFLMFLIMVARDKRHD